MPNKQDGGTDAQCEKPTQAQIDLALLFTADLYVGSRPLSTVKRKGTSLYLRYEIDGDTYQRSYLSPLSWRAIVLFALMEGKNVAAQEMDRPGRYRRLLPETLLRRLQWHARLGANFPPVARLYDRHGKTLLLTRSRLCGHGVDALHNLTDGGPVFQPLWIADILALRPMLGIELVRDQEFAPTLPISAYLGAAAMTGRVVDGPELFELPLTRGIAKLRSPPPSKAGRSMFDQACRQYPALEMLRGMTIDEDYLFLTELEKRDRSSWDGTAPVPLSNDDPCGPVSPAVLPELL
ncbi:MULTISPECIES: DUF2958 domain-containing protein [unclassified Rhizobium]|uniref:DUF2958 domain-containing protein n=1 Tax=unclassified Rhizobium TaxID=2613769 RepID=UPI001AE4C327|nr:MULTISPECIES: DUF2958 domain-containing protein [unclassified Rhizobium]MBP2461834.1 hypothetical protein [Rhizobium sp. PvP014]MBP2529229.1 hypothetical protein [Rhizobium sp. PvP099]